MEMYRIRVVQGVLEIEKYSILDPGEIQK
jgi:hypothetical protein